MLSLEASSELCRLLADPTRARLLTLLVQEELTVQELTQVTRLSQSRVSTHLARLRDARIVQDRRSGTSCFYSSRLAAASPSVRRLVELVRAELQDPIVEEDLERLSAVLRGRDHGKWADSVAGRMDRHYSPGRTWEATCRALLGFTRLGRVLDVASGDGVFAELFAARAQSVTCLDMSERVVQAGRQRLAHHDNVEFVCADMHALPFPNDSFDQVALLSALTYAEVPKRVVSEAARVLVPAGTLVATTLFAHRHEDVRERFDHVQLGFEPESLRALFVDARFVVDSCRLTCRERSAPYFEIITIHAHLGEGDSH